MLRSSSLLCFVLFCSACNSGSQHSATPPAAPTFITFDSPTNPATNLPLGGGDAISSTNPTDINASGYIVGYGLYGLADSIAFLRAPDGTISSMPSPVCGGGQGTQCLGINTAGTAVCTVNNGISLSNSGYPTLSAGSFMWNLSGNTKNIFISNENVFASAINDGSDIAGLYAPPSRSGGMHGFLLTSNGVLTSFDIPNATEFSVYRITSSDQIVGVFWDSINAIHGFLRSPDGSLTQIDAPDTGTESNYGTTLNDVNTSGVIVGSASSTSGTHSLSRTPDGSIKLFDPPGTGPVGSSATSINSSGIIVGTFSDTNSLTHGYIRHLYGTFIIIDDPGADQNPNRGTSLHRINDSGWIIGTFVRFPKHRPRFPLPLIRS